MVRLLLNHNTRAICNAALLLRTRSGVVAEPVASGAPKTAVIVDAYERFTRLCARDLRPPLFEAVFEQVAAFMQTLERIDVVVE